MYHNAFITSVIIVTLAHTRFTNYDAHGSRRYVVGIDN